MEWGGWFEEGSEGEHDARHGEGVRDLVDQAEPGAYVGDARRGREVGDGFQELGAWLDSSPGDVEPGKFHFVLSEAELARVQGDSVPRTDVEPLSCLMERRGDVVRPEQCVVDALGFRTDVGEGAV